jgi:hypothetical protein
MLLMVRVVILKPAIVRDAVRDHGPGSGWMLSMCMNGEDTV